MKRLGSLAIQPVAIAPVSVSTIKPLAPVAPSAPQPTLLDKIFGIGTKAADLADRVGTAYQNVNNALNPSAPQPYYSGGNGNAPGPAPEGEGLSTMAKVGIGVGIAAVVGTVVWLAAGGKKPKG